MHRLSGIPFFRAMALGTALTLAVFGLALVGSPRVEAAPSDASSPADATDCEICHLCPKPTAEDKCLRTCPRHRAFPDSDHTTSPELGPDEVVLDTLEELFHPTVFNHKIHAEMSEMAHGCVECHHYSPEGEYPPCRDCHQPDLTCENLKQVGLKGAYHRQCMRCHTDWSKETDCEICHASKSGSGIPARPAKPPRHYPVVEVPEEHVYPSGFLGGSEVTFKHSEHDSEYGLNCQDCHHGPGCLPCHAQRDKPPAPTPEAVGCLNCHEDTGCAECHIAPKGTPPYDRSQHPLSLDPFHRAVGCRKCHSNEEHHHLAPTECRECHPADWPPIGFTHGNTGVILDEVHIELTCRDCHSEDESLVPPECSSCHDSDIQFPDAVPGELTSR